LARRFFRHAAGDFLGALAMAITAGRGRATTFVGTWGGSYVIPAEAGNADKA